MDYKHGKRVCKDFEIKNWGEYHDLYLRGDVLLLANVFENFIKMCYKNYKNLSITSSKISFSSWISMASSFNKDRSRIKIINGY